MADLEKVLQRLQRLEDREEIRTLISRYSRAADRTDGEVLDRIVAQGVRIEFNFPKASPGKLSNPTLGAIMAKVMSESMAATHHMMGNSTIEIDGETATAETYCIAHHKSYPSRDSNDQMIGLQNIDPALAETEHGLIIGLRYLDKFEKRSGAWKLAHRRLVFDWSHYGVYQGLEVGGLYDGTPYRGARKDDPSYI